MNEDFSLICYDTTMKKIGIIDSYKSLIWTDKYNECGEFELYIPFDLTTLAKCQPDYYLMFPEWSEHTMIVEDITIEHSQDEGVMCKITGRSLESLLYRRDGDLKDIRDDWADNTIAYTFIQVFKQAIEEKFTNPENTARKVAYIRSTNEEDSYIEYLPYTFSTDSYETLYDAISEACSSAGIGFKMLWDGTYPLSESESSDAKGKFIFSFYVGINNTDENNPTEYYVDLSTDNTFMRSLSTCISKSNIKNVCTVIGYNGTNSDDEEVRLTETAYNTADEPTGLDRREILIDATSDLSPETDSSGNPILSDSFTNRIKEYANNKIHDRTYTVQNMVDGDIETNRIVPVIGGLYRVVDDYGNKTKKRATAITYTVDDTGFSTEVTFSEFGLYYGGSIDLPEYPGSIFYEYFSIQTSGMVMFTSKSTHNYTSLAPINMPMKIISTGTFTGDTDNYDYSNNTASTSTTEWVAKQDVVLTLWARLLYQLSDYSDFDFSHNETNPNKLQLYKNNTFIKTVTTNDASSYNDATSVTDISMTTGDVVKFVWTCNNKYSPQLNYIARIGLRYYI